MSNKQTAQATSSASQTTKLPEATPEELQAIAQIRQFGDLQGGILQRLFREAGQSGLSGYSPLTALTPQDEAFLNQSYQGAIDETLRQGEILGSRLSGRSGIRGSSTPTAQAVGREIMPHLAGLQSQRAQQRLNLGLENRNFAENQRRYNQGWLRELTQASPQNYNNLANYYTGIRMAQPTVTGSSNNWQSFNPGTQAAVYGGFKTFNEGLNTVSNLGKFLWPKPTP